jgi:integrase
LPKSGIKNEVKKLRADYIHAEEMEHILAALMPPNRLALRVSMATGLRIGDVLSMMRVRLSPRMTVREEKTGKSRRVYIPAALLEEMQAHAGRYWVFEHRTDPRKHRTRQAVYKDLRRAASLFRLPCALHLSPHSARKIYAVEQYHKDGNLKRVQQLLNHDSEAVTMLYAMADQLTARRLGKAR